MAPTKIREGTVPAGAVNYGSWWQPVPGFLRTVTPIIGFDVVYTSLLGEILSPERALQRMQAGFTVRYEVWEN